MIERQRRKCFGNAGIDAGHHHFIGIERAGDDLLQQLGKARHQFARLDHHPVAGGECGHGGCEGELQRIIPGRDDSDHAERLRHQPVASRQELQLGGDALRRHPGFEMLDRMTDLTEDEERLGKARFDGRTIAEIGGDRSREARFIVGDQRAQSRQPIEPLFERRRRRGAG